MRKTGKEQNIFERLTDDIAFLREEQLRFAAMSAKEAEDLARVMFNRTMETLKVYWKERF